MLPRKITDKIHLLGAIDWDRRLFDSLIPLPDGTSYNSYLIQGSEKTALLDSVDPAMSHVLMEQLESVGKLDYIISHHAEQDHSGAIVDVFANYPKAEVICSKHGLDLLRSHLSLPEECFKVVEDGETLSLGDKTLEFVYTPWVHWPETMVSYLLEDNILFSCDFFGSHIATTEMYVTNEGKVYEAAKRYFAEIMLPFRKSIQKNLEKIAELNIDMIAPSHGPIYSNPGFILNAYKDWLSDESKNLVTIIYVSMHGSTRSMVEHLVAELAERNIETAQFDLAVTDIGKLAINLVDATTLVIATPALRVGPHPLVVNAVYLASVLRPKAKIAAIIGSYGWGQRIVETIGPMIADLKLDILEPILIKGAPQQETFDRLKEMAQTIAEKHKQLKVGSTKHRLQKLPRS